MRINDARKHPLVHLFEANGRSNNLGKRMVSLLENDDFDPFAYLDTHNEIQPSDCVLQFSHGNEKLKSLDSVYLSLPAGYSCPFADACKSYADKKTGNITDYGDLRCYSASSESIWPAARKMRWRNYDLLIVYKDSVADMVDLILRSIDYHEYKHKRIGLFRIHESGDFFNQKYFDAWIEVAKQRPNILFYAYTKSLPYWQARKEVIPKNLRLIASTGGTRDDIIDKEGFRKAVVVNDMGDAIKQKLHIDVNDFLAAFSDKDFALLMHGIQRKGSGLTSQSRINKTIIKKYAKKFNISLVELVNLIKEYTS